MNLGGWEVFMILAVLLLLFGAKKIPELARGLGKGIREFKDATGNIQSQLEDSMNEKPKTPIQNAAPKENSNSIT